LRAATLVAAALGLFLSAVPAASAEDYPIAAAWPIDEGSGQLVRDISGRKNHGVLGSATTADANDPAWFTVSSSRWYRRSALRFAGDDYVTVANSPTLEPTSISVGAIVRSTAPGPYRYIASKGAIRCETASYGLYTGLNGGLAFYISNGIEFALSPDAGAAIWDGEWHAVGGTFDGSVVRLYVDGKQIGTGTPTSVALGYALPDNDRFYIGDYRGTCGDELGFIGDIDAVAIASKAFG